MAEADKKLAVLECPGGGKATTLGNLLYKCRGIDQPTLERLEKGGKNRYAKAFNDIQARNEVVHFYTPKNKIVIVEKVCDADGILIVTPHQIDKQLQQICNQLSGMAIQLTRKKALVLVNRLDEFDWSEDTFTDVVRATTAAIQGCGLSKKRYDMYNSFLR
ncbi:hypothetical protein IQ07DRAFT_564777 [Pyrenochaeta sp. DS3sAY3a]|nr:hypothetical protein IQ07DRAFT_564777 [Pyrenochaeta sp. DS3sAY3a]